MNMQELHVDATIENIGKVTEFVDSRLEELGCPLKAQMQIDIAIDELFGNIAHMPITRMWDRPRYGWR